MSGLKVGAKGKDAVAANNTLLGHNIFQHQELFSEQHGEFTKDSANAAKQMKLWLGYPMSQVKPSYDDILAAYLHGTRKRSPLMLIRAARRHGGVGPIKPKRKYKFPIPDGRKWTKIGWPYQGTHGVAFNQSHGTDNWESERAIDIGCAVGTPITAPADGTIGPQFGPLNAKDPRMEGIRMHLLTVDDEFYLAHLKSTSPAIKPGAKVKQGQILGASGEANGVAHLHMAQKNGDPAKNFF